MLTDDQVIASLPRGTEMSRIEFVATGGAATRGAGQSVVVEFPAAIQRRAVLVDRNSGSGATASLGGLLILTVPSTALPAGDADEEAKTLTMLRDWVDAGSKAATGPNTAPASLLMTLQGVQLFWGTAAGAGRVAILADPDRFDTLRAAIVEATFYENELRDIEQGIANAWPHWETDMPLAFSFDSQATTRKSELQRRYQQVLHWRGRLSRIAPQVHSPHVYPPTLASQVGERLRERTRMEHRHEYLGDQVEVFEDVYDQCGQRSSDYTLTKSGNTLEWIIILLLLAQILMSGFDMLVNSVDADPTTTTTAASTGS